MQDILQQIQSLKEDFMNLIEVEGLGQPASDVPPTTNKIKKDRRTKDGKVEVVSVEDELFPYDGNKREQYRQKILDTINGMIQGTATLEDLLQIVRQKKAPLKEAMELMENLINKRDQYHISKKSVADTEAEFKDSPLRHAQSLERMRFGYNNGKDDRKDVAKYRIGMHDGAKHQVHAYEPEYRCDSDTTPCDRAEETKNRIKRAHGAADALEEAMEVLESIISEKYVFPKKAVEDGNKNYLEADKKNIQAIRLAKKGFEKLNKKALELKKAGIDPDIEVEPGVSYGGGLKKEYQQALKTVDNLHKAQRQADRKLSDETRKQRLLRASGLKGVTIRQPQVVPTKKGDGINFKTDYVTNEKLEEALKLLEGFFVNDGRKDGIQHDIFGIEGTGVDAIRKIAKQTFGRTKKI